MEDGVGDGSDVRAHGGLADATPYDDATCRIIPPGEGMSILRAWHRYVHGVGPSGVRRGACSAVGRMRGDHERRGRALSVPLREEQVSNWSSDQVGVRRTAGIRSARFGPPRTIAALRPMPRLRPGEREPSILHGESAHVVPCEQLRDILGRSWRRRQKELAETTETTSSVIRSPT
jgi:hypothetical protein